MNLDSFIEYNSKNTGCILAIDYGSKKIGVAITDMQKIMAFPLKIIQNDIKLDKNIDMIFLNHKISSFVVGLPLDSFGNDRSSMNNDIRKFATQISQKYNIPYIFVDERMSTKGAIALNNYSGNFAKSKSKKDRSKISINQSWINNSISNKKIKINVSTENTDQDDAISAQYILESFLMKKNIAAM
jgi:putative Holliday junction resolvase